MALSLANGGPDSKPFSSPERSSHNKGGVANGGDCGCRLAALVTDNPAGVAAAAVLLIDNMKKLFPITGSLPANLTLALMTALNTCVDGIRLMLHD